MANDYQIDQNDGDDEHESGKVKVWLSFGVGDQVVLNALDCDDNRWSLLEINKDGVIAVYTGMSSDDFQNASGGRTHVKVLANGKELVFPAAAPAKKKEEEDPTECDCEDCQKARRTMRALGIG